MISTINEALDKIYSYVDYSMTHAKDTSKDVFTLDHIRSLMKKRGNPQNNYPVIHVAGTKGKGSVCAMLASALQKAGFKTGLYTSPHLIRFNERIMIDGKMISDADVIDLTNRITGTIDSMDEHISAFELMTAMAFEYFSDRKVDIAIIETGLGGRLDATNIVTPILSIITSISMDHTGFLGNTVEKIAAEKAGITKPNVPVICAPQPYPGAEKVIKETSKRLNSPWISIDERYRFINNRRSDGKEGMYIWRVEDQKLMERWCSQGKSDSWKPAEVTLPLNGYHQMQNTAVVYAAINKIKSRYNTLDLEKALRGIGETFWPCRFEKLSDAPLLYADGAHNIDSIGKLAATIDRYCGTKVVKCVFGASEDKDLREMIASLAPHVDEFIMTRSTHPRAANPVTLAKFASEIGRKNRVADTLEDALALCQEKSEQNVCYIVTGSLFVAGGFREMLMEKDPSIRYFSVNE